MPKSIKIHLLGSFHLVFDGKPVKGLDSPRLQSFLSYLLIHREAPQPRQQLAFLFWPDSNESQARTNLRNMLFKLREAFPEVDDFLEINQQTLWWKPDPIYQLDVDRFQSAVDQTDRTGSGKDQKAHRDALIAATELYTGDLLPSCYDDWIQPERERLRQAYLSLVEELSGIQEAEGNLNDAILQSRKLLRLDPLSESYYQQLIRLYAAKGDKARAVRTYHQCVEVLERELGLDPTGKTQRLYRELMARDAVTVEPPRVTEKQARLVGREKAWNKFQAAWLGFSSGTHLAVIMGEAGIGKTYLVEEFTRWARKGKITCLKSRSYPTEDELAYTPVTGLLRNEAVLKQFSRLEETHLVELARMLPELRTRYPDLPDPDRLSESWKRGRLFEASTLALVGVDHKLVIILDDLQWCDRETLDWLRFLLEYDTDRKVMIIANVRTEDLLAESPLIPFFAEMGGKGKITEILLERLSLQDTHQLASDLWGDELEERAAFRLYQETEGNPLFVAEMVRAGYLKEFGDGSDLSRMPPKVQAVIETRLNALSPETRELASLAASVGRGFDFELILHTGEHREAELLRGLDELWSRRLIRDEDEAGYNFSHDKFREVLYGEISPHRKTHYHKKIARALEEIHQDQLEVISPQLAYQFKLAGDKNKALEYYLMAGDQARLVFAQEEALEYYQAVADIGFKKDDPKQITLYSGMGKTLLRLTRYDESIETYQKMSRAAQSLGDPEQEAQAWLAMATVHDRQGNFNQALENTAKAEEIAQNCDCPREAANALLMKGQQLYRLGNVDQAEPLLLEALQMHQKNADRPGIGRCHNLLGLIADVRGDFQTAIERKQQAIDLFRETNNTMDRWWIGNITCNLANTASHKGEYQKAISLYQDALAVMADFGDQDWNIMCNFNLGASLVGQGEYALAEDKLGEVLELTDGAGWLGLSLTFYFLAESYLGQDQIKYAEKAALESLDLSIQTGAKEYIGAAWRALGKVASIKETLIEVHGESISAEGCFEKSHDLFCEIGADDELAHTLNSWARHEISAGDLEKGQKMWAEARKLFIKLDMPAEVERMEEWEKKKKLK